MSDGGKGSSPRPFSVTRDQFSENWQRIFGNKDTPVRGDQRVTSEGKLEEFRDGYWIEKENKS